MKVYNSEECKAKLNDLDLDWTLQDDSIEKEYEFNDFIDAFSFMTKVAVIAESKNHHPELYNVYNKVKITLSTHDYDGVTDKDFELALAIDKRLKS